MDKFTEIQNVDDILGSPGNPGVFNYANTFDCFAQFTKLYFKVVLNVVCTPSLYQFMLKLWHQIFENHLLMS